MSRVAAVTLVAVLLAGCQHALTRVALPGESPPAGMVAAADLHVGDEVRVVLRDGTIAGATIADLQPDALVAANGTRYAFADMTRLELRKVAAGTVLAFVLLMLAAGWELDP